MAIFGPTEVNLDYYTGWPAEQIVCLSPRQVQRNIVPNLFVNHLYRTGELSFDRVAAGAREPLVVIGETGAGDFLYVVRTDPQTVSVYWNHFGVGDTAGATLRNPTKQRHFLTLDIDSIAGTASTQIDGVPVLQYHGSIFPFRASRIEIGRNNVGWGYIGRAFAGTIHEVSRQVED